MLDCIDYYCIRLVLIPLLRRHSPYVTGINTITQEVLNYGSGKPNKPYVICHSFVCVVTRNPLPVTIGARDQDLNKRTEQTGVWT